jgi:hypothetical protein
LNWGMCQTVARRNKNALSVEAQGILGSPPPELPNYLLILCPFGRSVNVTFVMRDWYLETTGSYAEVTLLRRKAVTCCYCGSLGRGLSTTTTSSSMHRTRTGRAHCLFHVSPPSALLQISPALVETAICFDRRKPFNGSLSGISSFGKSI